ncbi:MAG TPA: phosphoribosylformylglycinamidine synthase I [Flavobacteriales bacterium]|jgi:phosphoribosylformylglycinamidine synthase I|nr:phosphoribosylformylglycinamidine synthase I [Flavobacteriales bacterium]
MKAAVITFPGSNCDHDMIYVLRDILGMTVNEIWHKDHDLRQSDLVVLPGGFSYGDYLRSGAIAQFSPVMKEVMEHARRGGYVLGICNGFQILCESGLLPGALLHNDHQKFVCKNVTLRTESKDSHITSNLSEGQLITIPIAHAEGRYYDNADNIRKLNDHDQVLFRYTNDQGIPSVEANPNGSVENIAGITNAKRNVFGMMPHPERAADPNLGNEDGRLILESILALA